MGEVGRGHEGFADEEGADAGGGHALDVRLGFDAGLGDEDLLVFDELGEADGRGEVGGEGAEVAVVDAQEGVGAEGEADGGADAEEGVHFVDFDEGGEAEFGGEDLEVDHEGVGEDFGDEEDGVGAGGFGFVDLVGVDDEVFAEDGKGDGGLDLGDVFEFSVKVLFIGENGESIGAGGVIGLRDGDGVEVFDEGAGGRRGFFDFRDDVDEAIGLFGEGGEEVAWGGGVGGALLEFGEGDGGFGGGDLGLFCLDDLLQDIGDGHRVIS